VGARVGQAHQRQRVQVRLADHVEAAVGVVEEREIAQQGVQRDLAARAGAVHHFGATRLQCGTVARVLRAGGVDTDAAGLLTLAPGVQQAGVQRQFEPAVDHHQMRLSGRVQPAHVELWIVFEHGANAGQHRAGACAPGVPIQSRLGASDPLALPVLQRGLPVDRRGDLHAHPGQAALHAAEKTDVESASQQGPVRPWWAQGSSVT